MSKPSQTNPYLQRVAGVDLARLHERIKNTASSYRRTSNITEVLEINAPPIEGVELNYDGYRELDESDFEITLEPEPLPEYYDRIAADIEAALAVGHIDYDAPTQPVFEMAPPRTMTTIELDQEDIVL